MCEKNKHLLTTGSWGDGFQKGVGGGDNRLNRFKVPDLLIKELLI